MQRTKFDLEDQVGGLVVQRSGRRAARRQQRRTADWVLEVLAVAERVRAEHPAPRRRVA